MIAFLDWSFLVWQQFQQVITMMVTDMELIKQFLKEPGQCAMKLRDIGLDFIWHQDPPIQNRS